MIPRAPTVRTLRRHSASPVELSFLLLLAALVLVLAPTPALGSSVPGAADWVAADTDAIFNPGPVCRASAYPADYVGRYGSSWPPVYYSWRPWGAPHGRYARYRTSWQASYFWGWQPYPAFPILFVNYWHVYPPFLMDYRSWAWYTYWMPWHPAAWYSYPPAYLPPHTYPRSAATRRTEDLAEAPRWDGSRAWAPSPEAQKWAADHRDQQELLATRGRFSPDLGGGPGGTRIPLGAPLGLVDPGLPRSRPGPVTPRPEVVLPLPQPRPTEPLGSPQIDRRTPPWPSPGSRRLKEGPGVPTVRPPSSLPRTGLGSPRGAMSPPPNRAAPRTPRSPASVSKPSVERPQPRQD